MLKNRNIILVTGPARSGKSQWAENLAQESGKSVVYVATAIMDTTDPEWQERIAAHQLRRPVDWVTLEVPTELSMTLSSSSRHSCLLIDSLGTWLANFLDQDQSTWDEIFSDFLENLQESVCDIIIVAEETGWGLVPEYPIGRLFRDRLGSAVRQISSISAHVYLVTGGYALNLTQLGTPLG